MKPSSQGAPAGCDLHGDRLPRQRLGETLICGRCGGRVPASAAVTFEGSDYVRHFCGSDCLARWCERDESRSA